MEVVEGEFATKNEVARSEHQRSNGCPAEPRRSIFTEGWVEKKEPGVSKASGGCRALSSKLPYPERAVSCTFRLQETRTRHKLWLLNYFLLVFSQFCLLKVQQPS